MCRRLVLLLALGFTCLCAITAAEDAPITLPAYQVNEPPFARVGVIATLSTTLFTGKVTALTVKTVRPNSLADKAGLKPGDEIVSVQGKTIAGLKKNEVIQLAKIPTGGELRLAVRADENSALREIILKLPTRPSGTK